MTAQMLGHSTADAEERAHEREQQRQFHELLKEMMYSVAQRRANTTAVSHVLLGLVTAPLMTLSISLQASIPTNRVSLLDILPTTELKREPARVALLRNAAMGVSSKQ